MKSFRNIRKKTAIKGIGGLLSYVVLSGGAFLRG